MGSLGLRRLPCRAIVLASVLVLGACGDDAPDGQAPYPAWSETTRTDFVRSVPGGGEKSYSGEVVGTKDIAGGTYDRYLVADVAAPADSYTEVWANLIDETHVEVIGGEYRTTSGALLGVPPYASSVMDEPMTFSLTPPLDQPQAFTMTGTTVIGDPANPPETSTTTGTYTLRETDAVAETPIGTVPGCSRFEVEATVPLIFGIPTDVTADVWYSPRLGLVNAVMTSPIAGLGLGFLGSDDATDLGGGYASAHKVAILGDGAGTFRLDTYDVNQAYDADKDSHAKMLLEVRWVDDAQAQTDQQPYVTQEFGTVFGWFPSSLEMSSVSFFYPEENGQGYRHWIAYVDQAAKNEAQNGIAYHIGATYEPSFSPVRVTARIVYKTYP